MDPYAQFSPKFREKQRESHLFCDEECGVLAHVDPWPDGVEALPGQFVDSVPQAALKLDQAVAEDA